MNWKVSRSKLKLACDTLGIRHSVRIRNIKEFEQEETTANGIHVRRRNAHLIYLNIERPIEDASETLWHELAHAYQSESPKSWKHDVALTMADTTPTPPRWKNLGRTGFEWEQYWNDPRERHARGLATEMAPLLCLMYKT